MTLNVIISCRMILFRLINVTMNHKLLIGVLASSIVPLITYIVSTIVAHVQLYNPENDEEYRM